MASLRGRSFSSVQSKVKRTTVPGNPGTFISDVRMTDDVMSDCVGGDYIIVKNRKKSRKWWATLRKRDDSTDIIKAFRGLFDMSSLRE